MPPPPASVPVGTTQIIEHIQNIAAGGKPDIMTIREMLLKLYQQIGQTQHQQLAIEPALSEMQKELEKHNRFAEQATRYQLAKTDMRALVYTLKPAHEETEPKHAICAACYDQSQRSILQPCSEKPNALVCPRCQSRILTSPSKTPNVITPSSRGRRSSINRDTY